MKRTPRTRLVVFKDDQGTVAVRDWLVELRDGIDELRAREGRVNDRMLSIFQGQNVAILAHALTEAAAVPTPDIERAMRRKAAFKSQPRAHSYEEDLPHGEN